MSGTLYVVATPIGNLEDITVRALRILREVALIAAEDTRRTAHLLTRYAIKTPSTSLHEHNEAKKSASLIARLQRGDSIALVSDAGTPGISDSGQLIDIGPIRSPTDADVVRIFGDMTINNRLTRRQAVSEVAKRCQRSPN